MNPAFKLRGGRFIPEFVEQVPITPAERVADKAQLAKMKIDFVQSLFERALAAAEEFEVTVFLNRYYRLAKIETGKMKYRHPDSL